MGKRSVTFLPDLGCRNAIFKRKEKSVKKKISDLSVLCGVDACLIMYGPDRSAEPAIWPEDPRECARIVGRYRQYAGRLPARVCSMSDVLNAGCLDKYSDDELSVIMEQLKEKIRDVNGRIDRLKVAGPPAELASSPATQEFDRPAAGPPSEMTCWEELDECYFISSPDESPAYLSSSNGRLGTAFLETGAMAAASCTTESEVASWPEPTQEQSYFIDSHPEAPAAFLGSSGGLRPAILDKGEELPEDLEEIMYYLSDPTSPSLSTDFSL